MLALLLASTIAACAPTPGVDRLVSAPGVRVVWFGEVHGTNEQPELFGDLVCQLGARQSVAVALERSTAEQPLWDAYLRSDGGAAAKSTLLAGDAWSQPQQDGRGSVAILALAERLRLLRRHGRVSEVRMILRPMTSKADNESYEARMAGEVSALEAADPSRLVLVLSGNAHAMKSAAPPAERKAAAWLPPETVVSLYAGGGPGQAWNCQADGCGPHAYSGPTLPRGVAAPPMAGFDHAILTGRATTASPPAVGGPPSLRAPGSSSGS